MELFNTLIIDPANPTFRTDFNALIFDNQFVVLAIIGKDNAGKKAVERADVLADDTGSRITRKVIWIPDYNVLKDESLKLLSSFGGFQPVDYTKVNAFAISPRWHETKFIIWKGEALDDFSINRAFWKASLRERSEV